MIPTILVTGDVVLDCHLYGGVKVAATSFGEPGTVYTPHLGGAALTHELVRTAADLKGLAWDAEKKKWDEANKPCQTENKAPSPWPNGLPEQRPAMAFETHLAFAAEALEQSLPTHLRSYGVWTAQPAKKGSKDRVWRVERQFGYGPGESAAYSSLFKTAPLLPPEPPAITLIDDGGMLFRQRASESMWPALSKLANVHYLLKMSWPLCRGDLWSALDPIMDQLIVVVSAADLRREDAQINSGLSWEQSAEHVIHALKSCPVAKGLLSAAHVIVSFQSSGALWFERGPKGGPSTWRLLFDPVRLEGDYAREFDGSAYGFQTCLTSGIAYHLMQSLAKAETGTQPGPFADRETLVKAMNQGITVGLMAGRLLLERGHGTVGGSKPGFPTEAIGQTIAGSPRGFSCVEIPHSGCPLEDCQWTILAHSETSGTLPDAPPAPLTGLAQLTARHGLAALSHVPALSLGNLFTVDRSEIESLRTLDALIRAYEKIKVQEKPLSIGVFGPPGAGKSFGVKALAKAILGDKVPFLEFNLSQFKSPEELIGAFHRVRDAVLTGKTPVAFWDEFDSQHYKWLQYLLAPMQDGAFQEGQVTHPIGKCVFIFAGGTSSTFDLFGVPEPTAPTSEELARLSPQDRAERKQEFREQSDLYREFKLLKGPDFISRLHGFLDVLGPNPRLGTKCPDITWPIRRALILRGILGLKGSDVLDSDPGLLHALLNVAHYRHGARSFEKIIRALSTERDRGRLNRSALPPQPLLARETNAAEFDALLTQRDAFKNHPDIEALAAAVHYKFLAEGEKSRLEAKKKANPQRAWTIDADIQKSYDELDADSKASNRAAARRVPDHLALIDYVVEPQQPNDDGSWKAPLANAIQRHIERLALAEHLGWCAERAASGWTYSKFRNNTLKHHPLLVPWADLTPEDQDKDRSSARSIPELLEVAKFKAVRVPAPR